MIPMNYPNLKSFFSLFRSFPEPMTVLTYLFRMTHILSSGYDVLKVLGSEHEVAKARMALYESPSFPLLHPSGPSSLFHFAPFYFYCFLSFSVSFHLDRPFTPLRRPHPFLQLSLHLFSFSHITLPRETVASIRYPFLLYLFLFSLRA
jgi:hypothetical protein